MTNIELPRDVDGREIPLDTKAMYYGDGSEHKVLSFTFSVIDNIWGVLFANDPILYNTNNVYLNSPDSWDKLLDDLDNAAEKASDSYVNEPCCEWFNDGGRGCTGCPADESPDDSCNVQLVKNIAARIRKLRGDSE